MIYFISFPLFPGFIELTLTDEKIFRHLHVTFEGVGEVKWPSLTSN